MIGSTHYLAAVAVAVRSSCRSVVPRLRTLLLSMAGPTANPATMAPPIAIATGVSVIKSRKAFLC